MIGARDMAFPRLNAFSFWLMAFGGILLYFSLLGANGLYGAGNAPDVGWFAYAPLTSRTFSPGHSTILDAQPARLRVRQHRHSGQHHYHDRVPALSWHDGRTHAAPRVAEPHHGGMVILANEPALRRADHAARRSVSRGTSSIPRRRSPDWIALLLDLRHPEVYVLVLPALPSRRDHSGLLTEADLRLRVMVAATISIAFIG